jgi:hypothetical protein
MKRRLFTSLAAATAATASILLASGAAAATPDTTAPTAGAQGAGVTQASNPLELIHVDETQYKIVASLRGVGKQVYDCTKSSSGGANAFTFREPIAGLFTSRGIPAAIHGKGPVGPFWANFDGSHVDGSAAPPEGGTAPSPDPAKNIPWLRLHGTPTPNTTGVFSNVAFIQRVDTHGGVAPTGPCTVPTTVAVDYTANYVFWAKK